MAVVVVVVEEEGLTKASVAATTIISSNRPRVDMDDAVFIIMLLYVMLCFVM